MKKGGLIPPPPTWRMQLGHYMEPVLHQIHQDITGKRMKLMLNQTFRHPKYPHMLATPDALCEDESLGADYKYAQHDRRHIWGPTVDDLPAKIQLQMHACMEVTDRDHWHIALLCGDRFQIYDFERDREFGAFLGNMVERIWKRYFEGDEVPPIGWSKVTAEWLKQKWPTTRADVRPATDAEIELLTEYGHLRTEQDMLARKRQHLENRLKDAIKDREGLRWPGGWFTWRRTKDGSLVDWESMAIALRTKFLPEDERQKLTQDYTKVKPGVRRIWFKSDQFCETQEAADAA
jgi:predicted phage-related endonuclease